MLYNTPGGWRGRRESKEGEIDPLLGRRQALRTEFLGSFYEDDIQPFLLRSCTIHSETMTKCFLYIAFSSIVS
jgi:hypothetical protein